MQATKQNIPVIEIFSNLDKPEKSVLVYHPGQEQALLVRNAENGVNLDYLNPQTMEVFEKAEEASVCELDTETEEVRYYYRIPIQRVDKEIDIKLLKKKG